MPSLPDRKVPCPTRQKGMPRAAARNIPIHAIVPDPQRARVVIADGVGVIEKSLDAAGEPPRKLQLERVVPGVHAGICERDALRQGRDAVVRTPRIEASGRGGEWRVNG